MSESMISLLRLGLLLGLVATATCAQSVVISEFMAGNSTSFEDEDGGTFQLSLQDVDMQIQEAQASRMIQMTNDMASGAGSREPWTSPNREKVDVSKLI